MLAAKKGHKDVILILTQNEANLDVVDKVSVYVHTTSPVQIKIKWKFFFLKKKVVNYNCYDTVNVEWLICSIS